MQFCFLSDINLFLSTSQTMDENSEELKMKTSTVSKEI